MNGVVREKKRPIPVTALGIILLTQSTLAAVVGAERLGWLDFEFLRPAAGTLNVYAGVALIILSPFFFISAIGFFRLWRTAWVIGMSLQGLGLLVSLLLHFFSGVEQGYVYGAMLYHILTVLYLNSRTVQNVFMVRGARGI